MAFPPTHPSLARALTERDYTDPTPVQVAVLEEANAGRDLLVSAQTGSGKTAAFGLALASTLIGDAERLAPASSPLALIIAPTRELALQVQRELEWLYTYAGARVVSCVGGMDPRRERRQLAEGVHIVVGTPGRLRDHLTRNALDVSQLKAVVLDEADEMLDLGFREDLEFILQTTPETRRTLLFSATLPKSIVTLAKTYQKDAVRIAASSGERGHADIEYRAIRMAPRESEHVVVNVLRQFEAPSAIVFCATRDAVRHLHAILMERGFSAVALSGELSQAERSHALQALRDGHARVCVATDVAARGIDLPGLNLVIHADLPQNAEVLQHRSGRTGRAGRKGVSVLLVSPARRRKAELILSSARVTPIWSGPPSPEDIRKLDQQRLMQDPLLTGDSTEEEQALATALLAERTPAEIAAALVRIYNSRLPAPEEVFDPGEGRAPNRAREPREPWAEREPRPDRAERAPRDAVRAAAFADSVWFRLGIGRKNNADPKWLLPLICRRGKISKPDIGSIRIFEHETRFQIAAGAAEAFASAVRKADGDGGRIELVVDGERPPEARAERAPRPMEARPPRPKDASAPPAPRRGDKWHPVAKPEGEADFKKRKPKHAKLGAPGGDVRPPYDGKKAAKKKKHKA